MAPTFVPANHLLRKFIENNAISVTGNAVDEVLFYGKEQALPTATSVLADVLKYFVAKLMVVLWRHLAM